MTDDVDDAALLARSRTDPAAFGGVFDRHYAAVHGYLRRRLGTDIADDLASETFVRAFSARERYDPAKASPRAWLFGIATHVLQQHRRREERELRAYARSCFASVDSGTDDIDARADALRLRGRLATGLAALPRAERDVLLLHAWSGLSDAEVAAALGVPPGTVRTRLFRARRRLRERIPGIGEVQDEGSRRGEHDDGRPPA